MTEQNRNGTRECRKDKSLTRTCSYLYSDQRDATYTSMQNPQDKSKFHRWLRD